MFGEHLIHPSLLATDLGAAGDIYHDRLGLELLTDCEAAIMFRCGGGTRLAVTWVSLDGLVPTCRPLNDRAFAMVSSSHAATRAPMARHQG